MRSFETFTSSFLVLLYSSFVSCSFKDDFLYLMNEISNGSLDEVTSQSLNEAIEQSQRNRNFKYTNEDYFFDDVIYGFPTIDTTSGMVMGQTNKDSHAFYSIPYAKPPVGELRWKPPVEATYDTELRNVSMQDNRNCIESNSENDYSGLTEDCLVVTVNVPSNVEYDEGSNKLIANLPVMVYIHGGAFVFGSGNLPYYNARLFVNVTNTVVVTMNYRLGAFGFLAFEENGERIEGNMGFLDQQYAMRWVQKNIENFGGDKNKVTLFGTSAGAQSVMLHLATESSSTLFHRGIMESNPAIYYYPTFPEAQNKTEKFLEYLNCSGYDTKMQCLKNLSPAEIYDYELDLRKYHFTIRDTQTFAEPFRPITDGVLFKDQALNLFRDGRWSTEKDIIIGTNADETVFFQTAFDSRNVPCPLPLFEFFNEVVVGLDYMDSAIQKYQDLYVTGPAKTFNYAQATGDELRDIYFSCPSRALTRFAAATTTANVYSYVFGHPVYEPDCFTADPGAETCGYSAHGSEVTFVFKTGLNVGFNYTEDDFLVSDMFSDYWGSFAQNGVPTSSRFNSWPAYVTKNDENLRFDAPNTAVESKYLQEICDYWDETGFYFYPSPAFPPEETTTQSGNDQEETTSASSALFPSSFTIALYMVFSLLFN